MIIIATDQTRKRQFELRLLLPGVLKRFSGLGESRERPLGLFGFWARFAEWFSVHLVLGLWGLLWYGKLTVPTTRVLSEVEGAQEAVS